MMIVAIIFARRLDHAPRVVLVVRHLLLPWTSVDCRHGRLPLRSAEGPPLIQTIGPAARVNVQGQRPPQLQGVRCSGRGGNGAVDRAAAPRRKTRTAPHQAYRSFFHNCPQHHTACYRLTARGPIVKGGRRCDGRARALGFLRAGALPGADDRPCGDRRPREKQAGKNASRISKGADNELNLCRRKSSKFQTARTSARSDQRLSSRQRFVPCP